MPHLFTPHAQAAGVSSVSGVLDASRLSRIQISPANPLCNGAAFDAMLSWLVASGCRDVDIQIADTLQRHNLVWQYGVSPRRAEMRARDVGREWVGRNGRSLNFGMSAFRSFSVSHWDFWTKSDEFPDVLASVHEIAETDSRFDALLDSEARSFFERIGRTPKADRVAMSRAFLLEEIAVSELVARRDPTNEIYPGARPQAELYLASDLAMTARFALHRANFIEVAIDDRLTDEAQTV